jgi:flagellar basal-body rod protein FlgF
MLRGLYAAATALDTAQQAHGVTAANLANVSTPGYKQQGARFETLNLAIGRDTPPPGDINGTRFAATYTDFRPGALQQTGNPFDLAVGEPDQFFAVQGPNGPLYTRDGSFRLTAQGQIVTQAGYPLLGSTGPLAVPTNASRFNVASDGSVSAGRPGPVGPVRRPRPTDAGRADALLGPAKFTATGGRRSGDPGGS